MENIQKEVRYEGYFIMEGGFKVNFNISADDGGEKLNSLYGNSAFEWEQEESIYLENKGKEFFILAKKVIGFFIRCYHEKL
jgi:hypothetical protein